MRQSARPQRRHGQIVGPLCTLDALTPDIALPVCEPGDRLAILDTGAYTDGEATNSNMLGRPAVVMVDGDRDHLIRRRETYDMLIARDGFPPDLATGHDSG